MLPYVVYVLEHESVIRYLELSRQYGTDKSVDEDMT